MNSKRLTPSQKWWAKTITGGGVLTRDKLNSWGYNISRICEHCGDIDTVWHRAWLCPFGQQARSAAPSGLVAKAVTAGQYDVRFSKAWFAQPVLTGAPAESGDLFFLQDGVVVQPSPMFVTSVVHPCLNGDEGAHVIALVAFFVFVIGQKRK